MKSWLNINPVEEKEIVPSFGKHLKTLAPVSD